MAVDVEDGYTRIANELLEAILIYPFTARQQKIIFAIIRKTYGFQRKTDKISLTQIATITGIQRKKVPAEIERLVQLNIITRDKSEYINTLGLNKNYAEWAKIVPNLVTTQTSPQTGDYRQVSNSPQDGDGVVPNLVQSVPNLGTKTSPQNGADKRKKKYTKEKEQRNITAGGKKSPPLSPKKAGPTEAQKEARQKTWELYTHAFFERYKTEPTRNATVNAQMSKFVDRVPLTEAPYIAEFYVWHNDRFYIRSAHSIGILLKDAEKLRTEWATGKRITETSARNLERTQNNFDVWQEVKAELEKEKQ